MKKILLIFVLFIFLIIPLVHAKEGHIKLLAVTEGDSLEGSIADLFLDVQSGTGRVFLETFPLSKLDTQMSTRFAKEVACDFIDYDCSKYDFFYTIKAGSTIIGGPSAGAAASLLTISVLKDIKLPAHISITGTINSGGLIGPVGGIKEKIEAASKSGITKVMIPFSEEIIKENKTTINITEYGKNLDVEIISVSDLNDVFENAAGIKLKEKQTIKLNNNYDSIMAELAEDLCKRTDEFQSKTESQNYSNFTIQAKKAYEAGNYYTAASFCFGANVNYHEEYILGLNQSQLYNISSEINKQLNNLRKSMPEIKTINDLQAYMAVEERLYEAEKSLKDFNEEKNKTKKPRLLAYASERIYSAESWSKFFGMPGKKLEINKIILKESCIQKISETEERVEYLSLYLPKSAESLREGINIIYNYFNKGNYEMCLLNAIKTKSEANIILSSLYTEEENIGLLLIQKLNAAKRVIAEETSKNNFPLMGYSYYNYANALKDSDNYAALLYSEYAIEMSKLDIYFQKKNVLPKLKIPFDLKSALLVVCGIIIGAGSSLLFNRIKKQHTISKKNDNKTLAKVKRPLLGKKR